MAFKLSGVVPWGRNLSEYRLMFRLTDDDMKKKIAGFGDGPASFNCEATARGFSATSFDPIYQFCENELRNRISQIRPTVMRQVRENSDNYVWKNIKSPEELEHIRISAMEQFLSDYENGKAQKRYIAHELPAKLPCCDGSFDIGLSSHFLLLYPDLGYDFHIGAITEMLRVCKEVRIFPIVDLDANKTELTKNVTDYFKRDYCVEILQTTYEFQKGGDKLLIIKNKRRF